MESKGNWTTAARIWAARASWQVAMICLLFGSASAQAAVPPTIGIEGTLTSTGGAAPDGNYQLTFAIYKDESGGNPIWMEGPLPVGVKAGTWSAVLGAKSPLTGSVLTGAALWVGLQVGTDTELPRRPLLATAFAMRAAVAESMDCTGCITAAQVDPKIMSGYAKVSDLAKVATTGAFTDLNGGPDLSGLAKLTDLAAYAKSSDLGAFAKLTDLGGYAKLTDLAAYAKSADLAGYVKASSLAKVAASGSYADLSGTPTPTQLGKTCGTGLVMNGINSDGSYACVASAIAPDLIDEVSNGLIWNQFTDSTAGKSNIVIPDGLGPGTTDTLNFPSIGQAQKIWINVQVTNSDMSGVRIELYGPQMATPYVLYNGNKTGTALTTNFNKDLALVSGNMDLDWVGKDIAGQWSITVKDLKSGGGSGGFDGKFSWSVNIQTLSNKKIEIKGDLIVDGGLTVGGASFLSGMVAPFNLNTCPAGWVAADGANGTPDMRGRLALGVGPLPQGGTVALGSVGGSHTYRIGGYTQRGPGTWHSPGSYSYVGFEWQGESQQTVASGGQNTWTWTNFTNHLPPYVGLIYCIKQ